MRSVQNQILILLLGALILLSGSFIVALGFHMKDRAIAAAMVKAQTDLATCSEIINQWCPGDWKVKDGFLYKGNLQISNQNSLVDRLSQLTGDTVTIFMGDTRVATTVRDDSGQRAIGTKVSDVVATKVLKNGEKYIGKALVVGHIYQTAYEPLKDDSGNIIGMFYVGISELYDQEYIENSIIKLVLMGIGLTIVVGLLTWFFVRKVIVKPLREITLGARDVATGHLTEKVEVGGPKEIDELAVAFNQMVERLESIAGQFQTVTVRPEIGSTVYKGSETSQLQNSLEVVPAQVTKQTSSNENTVGCELPKGLNQLTLKQILGFLEKTTNPISAEEVAEGVKLTRVTVRRYLEYLETCGVLVSDLKYGTVGRPVKLFTMKE